LLSSYPKFGIEQTKQPLRPIVPRMGTAPLSRVLHPEDIMKDADLVIIESWNDVPLKCGCSACPDVIFDAGAWIGNQHQQELTLNTMFSVHYDQVHQHPINC